METLNLPEPGSFANFGDWGTELVRALKQAISANPFLLLTHVDVNDLPSATQAGLIAYAANAAGAPEPVFSDGTNWRRVSDLTTVP